MVKMSVEPNDDLYFVDRPSYVQKFDELKLHHARSGRKDHCVLMFYGIGGIGKSRLQKHIYHKVVDTRSENNLTSRVDLEGIAPVNNPAILLHYLKKGAVSSASSFDAKLSFPRFEYALLMYYAKSDPLLVTKSPNSFSTILGTVTPVISTIVKDVRLAAGISAVSSFVQSSGVEDKVKKWWTKHVHSELEKLHQLNPNDILKKLPSLFAVDLNGYLDNNQEKVPIFFLDAVENIVVDEKDKYRQDDEWLRKLIFHLPKVLWVFAGREKIKWNKLYLKQEWGNSLYQYQVEELSEEGFLKLMTHYGINNRGIQKRIEAASERHPFYVELSIYHHRNIIHEGRTPVIEDFGNTIDEILSRFINHIEEDSKRDALKILSCLQKWDNSLLEALFREFNRSFYDSSAFMMVNNYSFVTKNESSGTYVLHQLMRNHLYDQFKQERQERVNGIHQFCFDYLSNQLSSMSEIELRKEFLLRASYHLAKNQPTTEVYWWIRNNVGTINSKVHFNFII